MISRAFTILFTVSSTLKIASLVTGN